MATQRPFPALLNEILRHAPRERDPRYFRTWQRVSLALQQKLREWIPAGYFADPSRFEDRETAYPILVYASARLCYGKPKTEFTYDVADGQMVETALYKIGTTLRLVLEPVEKRLRDSGIIELSARYSHIWRQDIL